MANTVKIPADQWLATAREALIEEGIAGVKVDRLAKKLGVTRGGFYHHFKNHKDLLDRLLAHWAQSNVFAPMIPEVKSPQDAVMAFNALAEHLITETDFSPEYEIAVREWARVNDSVKEAVDALDNNRMSDIANWFIALGCDAEEASIRARVFYFHQIGFYSLGYHGTHDKTERLRLIPIYMRILCGRRFQDAAEAEARKWV